MKTRTQPTEAAEAGFTLIELLAVLAVIAVAITAFTSGSGRSLETAKLRAAMARVASAIIDARIRAIRGHEATLFAFDKVSSQLPTGAVLSAAPGGAGRAGEGASGIWLYPDGTTSGGGITVGWQGQSFEIRVNRLTGNVSQHRL